MMSITDPNMSVKFTSTLEETHKKHLETYAKVIDTTVELPESHSQFVSSAFDTCLKKFKDDEMLFDTIQTFRKDLEQKKVSLKGKRQAISEMISEIQEKEMQKEDIIQKIEKLKEEQAKRTELIESQNKANKDRLRNLQKARGVFHDHLGMEIRTILGKTEQDKGKKLQFVFRNINPSKQDSAYVITMGITENGSYQIVSSDPTLECLSVLENQLQQTNNLPAFLAKVRKEFISQARCSNTMP
ncbi:kinetochore protein Spc25 isoform X2 [Acanthochromis polyacanthus]|uniref:Kinetochore protein SPC25 n=2 Tax=Acanthochromis polyacanthus TaxID=80966 RepID=A0A3Q1EJC3_9TELE|nr:kinetochore protein Spc25 isoform X2 [Acanthochromis polyacanthus]